MNRPAVLVIDDSETFVEALVRHFDLNGISAAGCSEPAQVLGWQDRDKFAYDLILLDMQLSQASDPDVLSALNLLPHIKTYAPSSTVVVFSDKHMTVEQALRCIRLGALTIVPKGIEVDELCKVAEVYHTLGDPQDARQELIDVLWEDLLSQGGERSGQRLEMLVINLFDSMPTFRVINNNHATLSGSADVLVENTNKQPFWNELSSLHLAVECKNEARPPEPADVNQLAVVVRNLRLANVGILVSMSGFTESFRRRQGEIRREPDGVHIFGLDADDLQQLVELPFGDREDHLRHTLEAQ